MYSTCFAIKRGAKRWLQQVHGTHHVYAPWAACVFYLWGIPFTTPSPLKCNKQMSEQRTSQAAAAKKASRK